MHLISPNLVSVWRHLETKPNEGSRIIYITEKVVHQHMQNTPLQRHCQHLGYELCPGC